ncbi:hypothetical protein [Microbacterium sp. HMWF026]|uniref:hypothetical protein n=1 Tax=Microbacterium sp. HMWF026 TaxID=2056861 RepID=UPI0011B1D1D1|nr:hypothetical protein [Microbacterium sp. HMWF026]
MSDDTNDLDDVQVKRFDRDNDPDGYTDDDVISKDLLFDLVLSSFVGFKDEALEGKIGVTLQCGGVTVSGLVISATVWVSAMAEQLREGGATELGDSVEKAFLALLEDQAEVWDRRDAADLSGRARRFIHMQDVKIFNGDRDVNVPLWRGALRDVSGWSLGSWNVKEESTDNSLE